MVISNNIVFIIGRFKYIAIFSHIWLKMIILYFVLDAIIIGKKEEIDLQNLVQIQNAIVPIGINQEQESLRALF